MPRLHGLAARMMKAALRTPAASDRMADGHVGALAKAQAMVSPSGPTTKEEASSTISSCLISEPIAGTQA